MIHTLLSPKISNIKQIVAEEILILQKAIGAGAIIPKDQEGRQMFKPLIFFYQKGNNNISHNLWQQECKGG